MPNLEYKNEVAVTKEKLERIKGIGPSNSEKLVKNLENKGIMHFNQLKAAVESGKALGVKGIGPTLQQEIEQYIAQDPEELQPKEEEAEEEKEMGKPWEEERFWKWLKTVAPLVVIANIVILFTVNAATAGVTFLISIGAMFFWALANWIQVGDEDTHAQGVVYIFYRAIDAVKAGRYFLVRPFQGTKQFPTTQYKLSYDYRVYTKEGEDDIEASQPIEGKVIIYPRFPDIDEEYTYPMDKEEAKRRGVEFEPIGDDEVEKLIGGEYVNRDDWVWGKISGKELLMYRTYPRLPIGNLMKEGAAYELGEFFEGGVSGALRTVFQNATTRMVKEEPEKIEAGIKNYLLVEEGNPAYEAGFSRENLDIEVRTSNLDEDTEQAIKNVEIASHNERSAEHEANVIEMKGKAFKKIGASPDLAAFLSSGGIGGEPLSVDQWRDIGITKAMVGEEKPLTEEELVDILKDLPKKKRRNILSKL